MLPVTCRTSVWGRPLRRRPAPERRCVLTKSLRVECGNVTAADTQLLVTEDDEKLLWDFNPGCDTSDAVRKLRLIEQLDLLRANAAVTGMHACDRV